MKLNRWTVGLVAIGAVSLASAAKAEEKATSAVTALTPTEISGYVDTSAQWNFGEQANLPPYRFGGPAKANGFNLDVVQLRIEKSIAQDEQDWAAGYRVDLWFGPDANALNTQSIWGGNQQASTGDFALRQAYVNLRVPIGRGLDFKMGVFDSIIGYESIAAVDDPNWTRSYGNTIEPQTETGLLATYHCCDWFSFSAGIANTAYSAINSRGTSGSAGITTGPLAPLWNAAYGALGITPAGAAAIFPNTYAPTYKSYMGNFAVTAPESLGFLKDSVLYAGIVSGYNNSEAGSGLGDTQVSYYVGSTLTTPINALRIGAAFDWLQPTSVSTTAFTAAGPTTLMASGHAYAVAGYASVQATEKLSFHGRVEYTEGQLAASSSFSSFDETAKIFALTATAQYDLWKNVLSRVEFRWDRSVGGQPLFGGSEGNPTEMEAFMLALNVIYKF